MTEDPPVVLAHTLSPCASPVPPGALWEDPPQGWAVLCEGKSPMILLRVLVLSLLASACGPREFRLVARSTQEDLGVLVDHARLRTLYPPLGDVVEWQGQSLYFVEGCDDTPLWEGEISPAWEPEVAWPHKGQLWRPAGAPTQTLILRGSTPLVEGGACVKRVGVVMVRRAEPIGVPATAYRRDDLVVVLR